MMFQDQIVQKLIWRQNSRRKFRNSESTSLNIACTEFHVKQSISKFWDQMWPNKVFSGWNLRKESSNSESPPLNTLVWKV